MDKLGLANMHIYMDLIRMLQEHWPDLLQKIIVVRGPAIFQIAYKVKPRRLELFH